VGLIDVCLKCSVAVGCQILPDRGTLDLNVGSMIAGNDTLQHSAEFNRELI
jgi:hypothetical protein